MANYNGKKEGIFRRSGVKSRINLLVQNNSSLSNLDHACPYDVADFLKGQSTFFLLYCITVVVRKESSVSFSRYQLCGNLKGRKKIGRERHGGEKMREKVVGREERNREKKQKKKRETDDE